MATSRWEELPFIIDKLIEMNPKTILDLGVGFGKIGYNAREYLECLQGKVNPKQWEIIIDGIEIHQPYHQGSFQNIIYNEIHYNDIAQSGKFIISRMQELKIKQYDLITAFDIIEHFEKEKAIELLTNLKKIAKHIFISIPLGEGWWLKGTKENPYEEHKSQWFENDLYDLYYDLLKKYPTTKNRYMGLFLWGG